MQMYGAIVCQVCIDGQPRGTGVLVSERHVLTTFHGIAELLDKTGKPQKDSDTRLSVVFDNIVAPGFRIESLRTTFAAAKLWLTCDSRFDDAEDAAKAPLENIAANRLDFALICLSSAAGLTAAKPHANSPRNWLNIAKLAPQPGADAQLLIAHYPGGADLRLSVGLFADHSLCNSRVRYRTPTVVGSSGAPCFTIDWKPYAIHNAGYSDVWINQGVPLTLIAKELDKAGTAWRGLSAPTRLIAATNSKGDPIFDREEIAKNVDDMANGKSPLSALVIRAASGGGKTYTGELIRSMVIERGHQAFLLDIEKFATDSAEAFSRRLVREISGQSSIDAPTVPGSRQRARWIARSLADWTREKIDVARGNVEAAPQLSPKIFVILDRCDKVKLSEEANELLVALIAGDEIEGARSLQFVLLGYDADFGAIAPELVWKHDLTLFSAQSILPYIQYSLISLQILETPEKTREISETFIDMVSAANIRELNQLAEGLRRWRELRESRLNRMTRGVEP
jgi:hypothetical protein